MKELLKMVGCNKNKKVELITKKKPTTPLNKVSKPKYEWHTPEGVFFNLEDAAKATGRSTSNICKICSQSDEMIMPHPKYPEEWFGKTWRELGYYVVKPKKPENTKQKNNYK